MHRTYLKLFVEMSSFKMTHQLSKYL